MYFFVVMLIAGLPLYIFLRPNETVLAANRPQNDRIIDLPYGNEASPHA